MKFSNIKIKMVFDVINGSVREYNEKEAEVVEEPAPELVQKKIVAMQTEEEEDKSVEDDEFSEDEDEEWYSKTDITSARLEAVQYFSLGILIGVSLAYFLRN